jgi:hypothetical protein
MNRAICTTLIAAIACAAFLGTAAPSSAAIACTATGKIPVVNSQGHLNTHFAVNCTSGQSWTVFGTVQAFVSGSWQRAGNTDEITVSLSGDKTVSAEVESGQWSCTPGRLYRSHAVLQNGNTDNSSAITLC